MFTQNFSVWIYDAYMKRSIADYKYYGRTEYTRFYAANIVGRLGRKLMLRGVEALVPVPCSRKRKRYRGYNQAELLAKAVGAELDIRVMNLLLRAKETKAQNGLNRSERKNNLSGALMWNSAYSKNGINVPEIVAVVDDIFTTGSTMDECSRVLLQNGVKKVYGVCICIGDDRA